jgi:D-alanyl-D-alanine carboxypeptidase
MKIWSWIALGLAAVVGIVLISGTHGTQLLSGTQLPEPDPEAALRAMLELHVDPRGVLGMAMGARLVDGTLVFVEAGSTDPSKLSLWTSDTVVAIGSVTKTFTAVVIMQLAEAGLISLDQTIEGWFPDVSRADEITIRMLLSHTSGIANYISIENVASGKWARPWTPCELIGEGLALDRVSEPGGRDAYYSNTAYVMLGLIIESATGNNWKDEVTSRILEPLEMADTTFLTLPGVLDSLMGGYDAQEGLYVNLLLESWYPHATTTDAAGEMVSTTADLMKFAAALFDGKLISQDSLQAMATPLGFEEASGLDYGLGGVVVHFDDAIMFGMGGDIPGFHAFFAGVVGTRLAVATVCNTNGGDVISPSIGALQYMAQIAQLP